MVLPNIREILVEIGFDTSGDRKARRDIKKLKRNLDDLENVVADGGREMDEFGNTIDSVSRRIKEANEHLDRNAKSNIDVGDNAHRAATAMARLRMDMEEGNEVISGSSDEIDSLNQRLSDLLLKSKDMEDESLGGNEPFQLRRFRDEIAEIRNLMGDVDGFEWLDDDDLEDPFEWLDADDLQKSADAIEDIGDSFTKTSRAQRRFDVLSQERAWETGPKPPKDDWEVVLNPAKQDREHSRDILNEFFRPQIREGADEAFNWLSQSDLESQFDWLSGGDLESSFEWGSNSNIESWGAFDWLTEGDMEPGFEWLSDSDLKGSGGSGKSFEEWARKNEPRTSGGPGSSSKRVEKFVERMLGQDSGLSRTDIMEDINETMRKTTLNQRAILAEAVDKMQGGGGALSRRNTPLSMETLRMALFEQFVNEDSEVARNMILSLQRRAQAGELGLKSVATTDEFGKVFAPDLKHRLRQSKLPNEVADGLSQNITERIGRAFDEGDAQFLTDLTRNGVLLDKVLNESVENIGDMVSDGEDLGEIMEEVNIHFQEIARATEQASEATQRQFEHRTAPQTRSAMRDDIEPFLGGEVDILSSEPREREQTEKRLDGIAKKIRDVRRNFVIFGRGGWPGLFPSSFTTIDKLSERFGFLSTHALRAQDTLSGARGTLRKLIPTMGAVSANLGPINISLRNVIQTVHGLTALVGPLLTTVLGLANAFIVAAGAMGAFVAVGALDFIDQMVAGMAGVNDRAEAMEKLMKSLKQAAIDAIEPLRGASVGGMGSAEAFVSSVNHGLALLHQMSNIARNVVELPVVAEQIERLRSALFDDMDGTFMEALEESATHLFPILADIFIYMIENLPEFISFINDVAKSMSENFGPALVKLIPLLGVSIKFGAAFLGILADFVNILLTVTSALGINAKALGGLIGVVGTAIGLLAVFSLVIEGLHLLFTSKLTVGIYRATSALYAFVTGQSLATASTIAFDYAVAITTVGLQSFTSWAVGGMSSLYGFSTSALISAASVITLSNALKVAKYALASTGVGLVIILLGELAAHLLYGESLISNFGSVWKSATRDITGFIDTVVRKAEDMMPIFEDMMAIAGLAFNPATLPAFAANVLSDGKGIDGLVRDMFSGGGPGTPPPARGGPSGGRPINVTVQGGDNPRLTGRTVGREIRKLEQRRSRFNGTGGYTP